MGKKLIKKEVFRIKEFNTPITWKQLKDFDFQDDDEVQVSYEEPYYSENNSYDGYFYAVVTRMVEETDEEYKKRKDKEIKFKEDLRERRFKEYIKLKREFGEE
jgi:hypothetical protein